MELNKILNFYCLVKEKQKVSHHQKKRYEKTAYFYCVFIFSHLNHFGALILYLFCVCVFHSSGTGGVQRKSRRVGIW